MCGKWPILQNSLPIQVGRSSISNVASLIEIQNLGGAFGGPGTSILPMNTPLEKFFSLIDREQMGLRISERGWYLCCNRGPLNYCYSRIGSFNMSILTMNMVFA